ncbi:hydrogenase maturation nickel metallochaperone HypA/HybF [Tsukamurella soli]|uniref:Hydrogenase maturation factor HypA n=1 Tax=Tsukamurella soli TaxID=644556 RepID=A0ABP8K1P3_9ACTN
MHELSLCRAVVGVVDRSRGGRAVSRVQLRVGQLRQVVPETLLYCWELVTAETPLAGARLEIDHVPVRLRCRSCGADTVVTHALVLVCESCGSGAVDVVAGEEFLVTTVHFDPLTAPAPSRSEEN